MTIRNYNSADKQKCIEVFQSNCPKYFDKDELKLFINWLDHQQDKSVTYKSPTYTNSEKDAYFVIEIPEIGVMGCGGFYIVKELNEARLAWGMIHADFHRQGYGKALYDYRKAMLDKNWPDHVITLGTSQHTYLFYEKMGMKVTATFKEGYGAGLDRYDMVEM
ncbi:MAG: GNAT family N-acetyltransferase [Bacteroidota bacterium]|nr:GNAT family N-acetyltransferase [Bacteroidota bacterium]